MDLMKTQTQSIHASHSLTEFYHQNHPIPTPHKNKLLMSLYYQSTNNKYLSTASPSTSMHNPLFQMTIDNTQSRIFSTTKQQQRQPQPPKQAQAQLMMVHIRSTTSLMVVIYKIFHCIFIHPVFYFCFLGWFTFKGEKDKKYFFVTDRTNSYIIVLTLFPPSFLYHCLNKGVTYELRVKL